MNMIKCALRFERKSNQHYPIHYTELPKSLCKSLADAILNGNKLFALHSFRPVKFLIKTSYIELYVLSLLELWQNFVLFLTGPVQNNGWKQLLCVDCHVIQRLQTHLTFIKLFKKVFLTRDAVINSCSQFYDHRTTNLLVFFKRCHCHRKTNLTGPL